MKFFNFFLLDFQLFSKPIFGDLVNFKIAPKWLWFILNQIFVIFGLFRHRSCQLHVFGLFGLLWPKLSNFKISKKRVFFLGGVAGPKISQNRAQWCARAKIFSACKFDVGARARKIFGVRALARTMQAFKFCPF